MGLPKLPPTAELQRAKVKGGQHARMRSTRRSIVATATKPSAAELTIAAPARTSASDTALQCLRLVANPSRLRLLGTDVMWHIVCSFDSIPERYHGGASTMAILPPLHPGDSLGRPVHRSPHPCRPLIRLAAYPSGSLALVGRPNPIRKIDSSRRINRSGNVLYPPRGIHCRQTRHTSAALSMIPGVLDLDKPLDNNETDLEYFASYAGAARYVVGLCPDDRPCHERRICGFKAPWALHWTGAYIHPRHLVSEDGLRWMISTSLLGVAWKHVSPRLCKRISHLGIPRVLVGWTGSNGSPKYPEKHAGKRRAQAPSFVTIGYIAAPILGYILH